MFKIKILPNGPYQVTALKNLTLEVNTPNQNNVLEGRVISTFDVQDEIHLCRCGQSKNAPFCDGSHLTAHFDGTETADRTDYLARSEVFEGDDMQLLDDERCAFARFCHRERGEVWTLTENSSDPENKREAIEGASRCPSGRLTARVHGELVEETFEDTIAVSEDLQKGVSASLNIRGDFSLESADGTPYEKRNRLALCRCGHSKNKPFCDASHVNYEFNDAIDIKK